MSRHYNDKEMREERREKREERRKKRERACARERTKARLCILFCFSIVAQRPRVSPPFRLGAADGLLLSLVHGLMRTACDEQKQHWYCIMDFGSHTSGSDMAECRAPADERRKKMVRERQNHNGGKQQGSKQLSNSKD